MVDALASLPEAVSFQTHAGTAAPFDFNGLVRHFGQRAAAGRHRYPAEGEGRACHAVARDARGRLKAAPLPEGSALKVAEPPPGAPPVLATPPAEICGPGPDTGRVAARKVRQTFKVRQAFESVPFIVNGDDSLGAPGRPPGEVLLEAGAIRFRPILLTARAAMIGAAVILSGPVFQGLAISLLFGLASSTALTARVIPALHVVLRGGRPQGAARGSGKGRPSA